MEMPFTIARLQRLQSGCVTGMEILDLNIASGVKVIEIEITARRLEFERLKQVYAELEAAMCLLARFAEDENGDPILPPAQA